MQQPSVDNFFSTCTTVYAAKISNPERGSSKNIMLGLEISSTAIAVLFFSPPEMPLTRALPARVSAHFSKPKASKRCSVYATTSFLFALVRSIAARCRISRGVANAGRASSCITYAILDRTDTGFTTCPMSEMSPSSERPLPVVFMRPARMLSKEVLPAPEGPNMQAISPGWMKPDTLFNIFFSLILNVRSVHSMEFRPSPESCRTFVVSAVSIINGRVFDKVWSEQVAGA
mmetsp:Transcript_55927/g.149155  ORF Transcript_55927/g.149155 Transcript_55927/m.149155 type:complete len:231 (+) Transcript_55927:1606-2298(+)